ncbi:MAG TPA: histidine kinase [Pedobacter sp.]|jgi:sensor histidine kinase YesM
MKQRGLYIKQSLLTTNLWSAVAGLGIAAVIVAFISVTAGKLASYNTVVGQLVFSVCITMAISNSVFFAQRIFTINKGSAWVFLAMYYGSSLLGVAIGVELAYFILSLILNFPFKFLHFKDMGFSAMVALIVCTMSYMYFSQKERLTAKIQEKELDMLRLREMKTQAELATLHSKINPHFLYNSLNSIASLIHEDPDKAESMTLKLSKLFRNSINQGQESMIKIKDEVEIVKTYLEIEKVRFGDRIDFEFDVDEETMEHLVPRFLLQPLVENALKHGLAQVAGQGKLIISIGKVGERLRVAVSDNGKEFPKELEVGYGLQSTYDKLNLLYGKDYDLHILNEPEKQIEILLPLRDVASV